MSATRTEPAETDWLTRPGPERTLDLATRLNAYCLISNSPDVWADMPAQDSSLAVRSRLA
jgi:hypothetical protein